MVYDDVIEIAKTFAEPVFDEALMYDYPDPTVPITLFGKLQCQVVKSTETGLYSFYYRVTNDASSVAKVFSVVIYPPMSTFVEVDFFHTDTHGEISPDFVDSGLPKPYTSFNGQDAEIEFQIAIYPGMSSKLLLVLPFAKTFSNGIVDFKNSGATGFLKTGGTVALGISTTLLPIGFVFPAPTVLPPFHKIGVPPIMHPGRNR